MPTLRTLAHRTLAHNGLFAGLACALALAVTAGPALAQTTLDRVEVNGKLFEGAPRVDVRDSCPNVDIRLEDQLMSTWFRDRAVGTVDVTFVVKDAQVQAVQAHGGTVLGNRDVRRAVRHLNCSRSGPGTSIYRMQVAFVDPAYPPSTVAAGPSTFVITASR